MRAETALACLLGVGLLSTSHAAFATSATLRSGAVRPGLCMKKDAAALAAAESKGSGVPSDTDAAAGPMSRRSLLGAGAGMLLGVAAPVYAGEKTTKMTGMSNAELAKAVEKDVVQVRVPSRACTRPPDHFTYNAIDGDSRGGQQLQGHHALGGRRCNCVELPLFSASTTSLQGQFMVTGDLTRGLYDEGCTFTDEIDTYSLDKWIQGTQKLFKNDYSHMDLDGGRKFSFDQYWYWF